MQSFHCHVSCEPLDCTGVPRLPATSLAAAVSPTHVNRAMADTDGPPSLQFSTAITANDHGAQVVVVGILCLVASALALVTRLSIRWPWRNLFGFDDFVCVTAMLLSLAQTSVVFGGVGRGFGKRASILSSSELAQAEKFIYASNLLLIAALCFGKLAIATLFCRLSAMRASNMLMVLIFAYGVAGICVIALGRPIRSPWDVRNASPGSTLARWASIEAIGMLVDIVLIGYPILLVRNLKMSKSTKVAVMLGFALRFPVIIFSALRLGSLAIMDYSDFTYSYVDAELFAQAEMHYNTIAATIPCLRMFLKGWQTGFLGTALREMDPEEYTRHSSMAKSPRTPHTSSNKSKRVSWKRRQRDMSEIFDGDHRGPQTSVSSQQDAGNRSVSCGSGRSITVEHRISVDI
ncbi:hypothetical protein AC579_5065 [Pseudocercospora musae]|uniref:Rhodopsin domain-containing protein n=1 Tax=Pseudocercospora musae TaxID=113226 RepID=A0A139HDR5_9PEZI|nr:hypothetical protein AC579_5065 [Pseudocercospora musae]